MRQTWEEIGLDLAEREYTCIGQLDDREITTSLGKRLLMILSPFGALQHIIHSETRELFSLLFLFLFLFFINIITNPSLIMICLVFLHLSPYEPTIDIPADESEVSIHWVPVSALLSPHPTWSFVTVDISSRLAPRHNILRTAVRLLVGNMRFRALVLTRSDLEEADDLHRARSLGMAKQEYTLKTGSEPVEELRVWGLTLGMTL